MTETSTEPDPQTVGRLAAFRYRDFRLYWASLFISNIGTWMQMTATNWLLYQLTNSPMLLGLNGVFRAAPAIALGLISGTFVDRYDRRWLLLWTQLILGLLALGLGILDHSGNVQAWQIYAFTFFSAAVGSLDGPRALSALRVSGSPVGFAQRRGRARHCSARRWAASPSASWAPPGRFTLTPRAFSPSWSRCCSCARPRRPRNGAGNSSTRPKRDSPTSFRSRSSSVS